jgi:hypothetical protein
VGGSTKEAEKTIGLTREFRFLKDLGELDV